jgi:hypothetical protein
MVMGSSVERWIGGWEEFQIFGFQISDLQKRAGILVFKSEIPKSEI